MIGFLDAFALDGDIYLTGWSASNFFRSNDNGLTFERVSLEQPTELTQVEVINNIVLSQRHTFDLFYMADENLQKIYPIQWNSDFDRNFTNNYSLDYFNDNYYLSVSKADFCFSGIIFRTIAD